MWNFTAQNQYKDRLQTPLRSRGFNKVNDCTSTKQIVNSKHVIYKYIFNYADVLKRYL